jgi:hypothetical protein
MECTKEASDLEAACVQRLPRCEQVVEGDVLINVVDTGTPRYVSIQPFASPKIIEVDR